MPRKKSIELVQEVESPKALIVNGGVVSPLLVTTLKDQGCEVTTNNSYSSTPNKFDYIFLFDNQSLADEIFEKNLLSNGKFILIETSEEIPYPMGIPRSADLGTKMGIHSHFRILKIGDPALWNLPQLANKILRTLFSSSGNIVDLRRKPKITLVQKKEIHKIHNVIPSTLRPSDLVGMTKSVTAYQSKFLITKSHRFNLKKIFFASVLFFLVILIIFVGISYMYLSTVQKTFANLEYHLKSSNITLLRSDLTEAEQEIKTIRKTYNFLSMILFPFKNSSYMLDFALLLDSSEQLIVGAQDLSLTVVNILPNKSGFGQVTENLSRENLIILEKKVENFTSILFKSQENIDKVTLPYFPKEKIKTALSPIFFSMIVDLFMK